MASRFPRWLLVLGVLLGSPSWAAETQRTHLVHAGQRLGSIAKRYNVSIEALCGANGIRRTDPIRPGQRLIVPERDDRDGSAARARAQAEARSSSKKPGEVVPAKLATSRAPSAAPADKGYLAYTKPPHRKGLVELWRGDRRFRGYVFDRRGRLLPKARSELSRLLGATQGRPALDARLFELLVAVSDKFGGRPVRIVGGYRANSYFEDSRHKSSKAVDFSIPGVPNNALVQYLRTLPRVGVGYYPNSSFVHLDVREFAAYWVDYSGPGEAPRRRPTLAEQPAGTQPEPEARATSEEPLEPH